MHRVPVDSSKASVTQIAPVKRSGSQIDRQNHRQECRRIIYRNKDGANDGGVKERIGNERDQNTLLKCMRVFKKLINKNF